MHFLHTVFWHKRHPHSFSHAIILHLEYQQNRRLAIIFCIDFTWLDPCMHCQNAERYTPHLQPRYCVTNANTRSVCNTLQGVLPLSNTSVCLLLTWLAMSCCNSAKLHCMHAAAKKWAKSKTAIWQNTTCIHAGTAIYRLLHANRASAHAATIIANEQTCSSVAWQL